MIVMKSKHCEGCRKKVATKYGLFWHTDEWYITIRGDDVPGYVNYEDNTTPFKSHYCFDCWNRIKTVAKNFKSEVEPF